MKGSTGGKISVVIPTYNGEQFIADTLNSILNQTVAADEIIVIDDGSTDETEKIVASFSNNIRFFKQPHSGNPTSGRNRGIIESKGNFIAFIDQDDLWPPNKLETQIKFLQQDETIDIVVGKTQIFRYKANRAQKEIDCFSDPKFNLLLSAALIKRKVFDKIGLFDETFKFWGSDGDWFLRAREMEIPFHFHQEISLFWQHHSSNTSRLRSNRNMVVAEVLKKSLNRRRNVNGKIFINLPTFVSFINNNEPP